MSVSIGSYVSFNNNPFILASLRTGDKALLVNAEGDKKQVALNNVQPINCSPAVKVQHRGASYLVTAKSLIISLTSNKVMQWKDGHGSRTNILASAALTRFKIRGTKAAKQLMATPTCSVEPCDRCGGRGYIAHFHHHDGGVCYKCR